MDKPRVLVSFCLLGAQCRYDGQCKPPLAELARLQARFDLIPICPEQLGGLATPRPPAERRGSRVVTASGLDVTEAYARGAQQVLQLARQFSCRAAILKAKSPGYGSGLIYDGSFTGRLTEGSGVTARLLEEHGVQVYGESEAGTLAERGEAREEGQRASRPLPSKYPGKND